MLEYERKDLVKHLKNGAREGRRWMASTDSEAVRIYDRSLACAPVTIELYGRWAKIVDYSDAGLSDEAEEEVVDLVNRMVYIEKDHIIFQRRKKREGLEQHGKLSDEAVTLRVKEHGLSFRVDLTSHIDTGLFLDMTPVRDYVRSISADLDVLNLFSYTGAFSVYAAAGGAKSVTSVDMSNTYSAICRENLNENGFFMEDRFPVVVSDCMPFIEKEIARGAKYDLVIFDPPSFSNSHKMDEPFDVQKDHVWWIWKLSQLMKDHSLLIFSVNLGSFALGKNILKQAFKITELTGGLVPFGFTKAGGGRSRIWVLEKVAAMKEPAERRMRTATPSKRRNQDRRDMKEVKDEDLERLVLSMDKEDGEENRPGEDAATGEGRDEMRRERSSYDRDRRPFGRDDRRPSYNRDGRRSYGDRDDRRSFGRDERRSYGDRDERRSSYNRDDRRPFGERDNRRPYDRDRRSYGDRDDRRSYGDRDDRRSFGRDDRRPYDRERRSFGDRDERRSSYNRDDRRSFDRDDRRPSFNRDERRSYGDRDDRRSFGRDERRPYGGRDNRRSFGERDERRSFDERRGSQKPYERRRQGVKPYGYDDIRRSRDRGDDDKE